MNKLCTICARSSSKDVPKKNIRTLCGKPLIGYTIEQAIKSNLFTSIVVSTDSHKIAKIAEQFGVKIWFLRSKKLSGDSIPKINVIKNALFLAEQKYELTYDIITDLDVTSPLRSIVDIKKSFAYFINGNFDNLITGCTARRNPYFNMIEIINKKVVLSKKVKPLPNSRQEAPVVFEMNASIYIWKRNSLVNQEKIITNNTGLYKMPEDRSYDIDTMLDFKIVENIMKNKLENRK